MIDVRDQFPIAVKWPRLAMDWGKVDGIVIHHTAVDPRTGDGEALLLPAANMTQTDELNHIRVIHIYHMSKGWGGFAYHFIVFPSGRCYYVVDLHQWGTHVAGKNDRKFGVVLAGDFTAARPGPDQFAGVDEAILFVYVELPKWLPRTPHSQETNTTCPGMAWPLPEEDEMSILDTPVPPPTTAAYLPLSTKLPTSFGGKWPGWSLLKYVHYGFLLTRRLQDAVKGLWDWNKRLAAEKVAWTSIRQVAAQANGAPKRGPHSLASWIIYFYRWNWDRRKETKALAIKVTSLEDQVASLGGAEIAALTARVAKLEKVVGGLDAVIVRPSESA